MLLFLFVCFRPEQHIFIYLQKYNKLLCYTLLNLRKSWHSNFSFYDLAITCGPPPPVLYGKVEGSDYRWGASVSYSCAEGYQLSNTAILSCEGRGIWRGDIPQCLRKFSVSIVLGSQTFFPHSLKSTWLDHMLCLPFVFQFLLKLSYSDLQCLKIVKTLTNIFPFT